MCGRTVTVAVCRRFSHAQVRFLLHLLYTGRVDSVLAGTVTRADVDRVVHGKVDRLLAATGGAVQRSPLFGAECSEEAGDSRPNKSTDGANDRSNGSGQHATATTADATATAVTATATATAPSSSSMRSGDAGDVEGGESRGLPSRGQSASDGSEANDDGDNHDDDDDDDDVEGDEKDGGDSDEGAAKDASASAAEGVSALDARIQALLENREQALQPETAAATTTAPATAPAQAGEQVLGSAAGGGVQGGASQLPGQGEQRDAAAGLMDAFDLMCDEDDDSGADDDDDDADVADDDEAAEKAAATAGDRQQGGVEEAIEGKESSDTAARSNSSTAISRSASQASQPLSAQTSLLAPASGIAAAKCILPAEFGADALILPHAIETLCQLSQFEMADGILERARNNARHELHGRARSRAQWFAKPLQRHIRAWRAHTKAVPTRSELKHAMEETLSLSLASLQARGKVDEHLTAKPTTSTPPNAHNNSSSTSTNSGGGGGSHSAAREAYTLLRSDSDRTKDAFDRTHAASLSPFGALMPAAPVPVADAHTVGSSGSGTSSHAARTSASSKGKGQDKDKGKDSAKQRGEKSDAGVSREGRVVLEGCGSFVEQQAQHNCDVFVHCGAAEYALPSSVLASVSPYFAALCSERWRRSDAATAAATAPIGETAGGSDASGASSHSLGSSTNSSRGAGKQGSKDTGRHGAGAGNKIKGKGKGKGKAKGPSKGRGDVRGVDGTNVCVPALHLEVDLQQRVWEACHRSIFHQMPQFDGMSAADLKELIGEHLCVCVCTCVCVCVCVCTCACVCVCVCVCVLPSLATLVHSRLPCAPLLLQCLPTTSCSRTCTPKRSSALLRFLPPTTS